MVECVGLGVGDVSHVTQVGGVASAGRVFFLERDWLDPPRLLLIGFTFLVAEVAPLPLLPLVDFVLYCLALKWLPLKPGESWWCRSSGRARVLVEAWEEGVVGD